MKNQWHVRLASVALALVVAGCTIDPYTGEKKTSNTAKGAGLGALAGAAIGAMTAGGDKNHSIKQGILAGAAVGAGAGYYMDSQEAKLRQRLESTGVRVERIGDTIKLIMPGNITFDSSSSSLRPAFTDVLNSVVEVVREFDKTLLQVNGYTDSTGSYEYNQQLSEQRAHSVARHFLNSGITASRVRTMGMGPRDPIASNDSAGGRSQNRRVELSLIPTG
ncbi:MAG: outer membrane protein OmpA-like peptidoglycan-associated protein [Bermanella sp.]|jgi:outer membrane protein OmpA-like peptidoglycan-associated protein